MHVGSHVPPLVHEVVDALVVEHARPHAPQLAVVSVDPHPPELLPELLPLLEPLLLPELLPLLLPEELELDESSPPSSAEPLLLPLPLPLDDEPEELPDEEPLLLPLLDVDPLDEPEELLVDASAPPPELLLLAFPLFELPPMQTEIVVDVEFGADCWQVCPEGQPCDPSQKDAHDPPMQMSFSPHVAVPWSSSHDAPSVPGPALTHA